MTSIITAAEAAAISGSEVFRAALAERLAAKIAECNTLIRDAAQAGYHHVFVTGTDRPYWYEVWAEFEKHGYKCGVVTCAGGNWKFWLHW